MLSKLKNFIWQDLPGYPSMIAVFNFIAFNILSISYLIILGIKESHIGDYGAFFIMSLSNVCFLLGLILCLSFILETKFKLKIENEFLNNKFYRFFY